MSRDSMLSLFLLSWVTLATAAIAVLAPGMALANPVEIDDDGDGGDDDDDNTVSVNDPPPDYDPCTGDACEWVETLCPESTCGWVEPLGTDYGPFPTDFFGPGSQPFAGAVLLPIDNQTLLIGDEVVGWAVMWPQLLTFDSPVDDIVILQSGAQPVIFEPGFAPDRPVIAVSLENGEPFTVQTEIIMLDLFGVVPIQVEPGTASTWSVTVRLNVSPTPEGGPAVTLPIDTVTPPETPEQRSIRMGVDALMEALTERFSTPPNNGAVNQKTGPNVVQMAPVYTFADDGQ